MLRIRIFDILMMTSSLFFLNFFISFRFICFFVCICICICIHRFEILRKPTPQLSQKLEIRDDLRRHAGHDAGMNDAKHKDIVFDSMNSPSLTSVDRDER